jgi:hypothetical protein
MNTRVLAAAILLTPVVFGLLTGAKSDAVVFLAVLGSGPILIGLITQRMKGRSGAAWWFLCLVALFFFFPFFATSFSGVINDPGQKPLLIGLSGAILFGVMPLVVIVFTSQRRTIMREFERILKHPDHRRRLGYAANTGHLRVSG